MGKLKIWELQEDRILIEAASNCRSKKWRRASMLLHDRGYDRSEVECRERYVNHLDPTVRKEVWSEAELATLYESYAQHGNKWYMLQRCLPGRTQTKIKNQFYGNIRLLLKTITRYCLKTSSGFINDIRTDSLLHIYEGHGSFQGQTLVKSALETLRYQVDRKQCETLISENWEDFNALAQKLVKLYWPSTQSDGTQASTGVPLKLEPSTDGSSTEGSLKAPRVEIVILQGGKVTDLNREIQYVQNQLQKHKKMVEHYQKLYESLLCQEEDDEIYEEDDL